MIIGVINQLTITKVPLIVYPYGLYNIIQLFAIR